MRFYNLLMKPAGTQIAVQVGEGRPASAEVVEAQRQWLKDGTVPASYLPYAIGSQTEYLVRASSEKKK
jgi:hypothetical protein